MGSMKLPVLFQRLEGAAILAVALLAYAYQDFSWWLFALLFIAIDLFMAGYLANPKLGAVLYNIGHSLVLPFVLLGIWILGAGDAWLLASLPWFAHIGMDRLFGYGLKLPSAFTHTHLGTIGRPKQK